MVDAVTVDVFGAVGGSGVADVRATGVAASSVCACFRFLGAVDDVSSGDILLKVDGSPVADNCWTGDPVRAVGDSGADASALDAGISLVCACFEGFFGAADMCGMGDDVASVGGSSLADVVFAAGTDSATRGRSASFLAADGTNVGDTG